MNSITGKHAFFMTLALRLAGDLTFGAKTPILAGLCYSGDNDRIIKNVRGGYMEPLWNRIQSWSARTVLYVLVVMALASLSFSAFSHWMNGDVAWWAWWDSAAQNFSTEMMGAMVTFVLFELILNTQLNKRIANTEYYNRQVSAISRLRQAENSTQKQAILDEMNHLRLFDGANLQGMNLEGLSLIRYDLQNVNLNDANLSGTILMGAKLNHAKLSNAKLLDANFSHADLEHADLSLANLEKTNFRKANLNYANLWEAELIATNLRDASLEYANLEYAVFRVTEIGGAIFTNANLKNALIEHLFFLEDDVALAPDKTSWIFNSKMYRFVDPLNAGFWRSSDPKSPAYHGEK
jgi:uncharacterized protein YjbI with pentapeptide repeats